MDADIEACFDSIDHTALMDRVRARVKDKRVLWLSADRAMFASSGERMPPCGVPVKVSSRT
ncbi:hypothetical protein ACWFR5_46170 [Streptomyces sp. NPDC055092]